MSTNPSLPSDPSPPLFAFGAATDTPAVPPVDLPAPEIVVGPATPETDAESFADQVINESQTTSTKNPLDRGVCVSITFRKWGNTSEGDKSLVEMQADKDMMRVGKYLIRSDEYNAICQFDGRTRKWIKQRAQPSLFKSGIYLVAKTFVKKLDERLELFKEARQALVAAFLEVYASQKAQAEIDLKDQYDPRDYPSREEMAGLFGIEWDFLYLGTPESLKEIDPELFDRASAKLDERMRYAGDELVDMMRAEGLKALGNLVERIAEPEDGEKKKILKASAVTNVTDFLEFFNIKNDVNDDGDLARLVERTRQALTGNDGQFFDRKTLKDNDAVRAQVREQLSGVVGEIQNLMVKRPIRKIILNDEE